MGSSTRKLIAIVILFTILIGWIVAAATIGSQLTGAPRWLQLVFYIFAGVAWVLPLRPVFKWMNSAPDREA